MARAFCYSHITKNGEIQIKIANLHQNMFIKPASTNMLHTVFSARYVGLSLNYEVYILARCNGLQAAVAQHAAIQTRNN